MVVPIIPSKQWSYGRLLYGILAILAVIFTVLTYRVAVLEPVAGHGTAALFLIKMTVVLPEVAIWLLAAISAKRFKDYAVTIRGEADGRHMNYLANGLLWLLSYVVVICILSPIQALRTYHGQHLYGSTVLFNHLPIIFALVAAAYVFIGSRGLAGLTRSDFWTRRNSLILLAPFTVFMLLFVENFYAQAAQLKDVNGNLRFALPVTVLLFTYVLPHIVIWLLGLFSGFNIWWYQRRVQGAIYKQLFLSAQKGIVCIFVSIFLAQLLICSPYAADNFQIGILLVYAVLLLAISGYLLLYKGAKQLQKIETII